ncbi:MAG: hypothetical protein FJX89_11130 [Bacteroidetes bacterium]|nr:hypothetical protein [Bacteroidota bacterium]
MEVHHPHHPTHKKKWREYFLEFFMLFLAVSLGFLAENYREHYIEKERAHELLNSFIKDVQTNIKFIDSMVQGNKNMIIKNDSAILYLLTNETLKVDSFFNLMPVASYRYLYNNETYEQMKNSGSLRYIKDTILLRHMIDYSNLSKSAEYRSLNLETEYVFHEYTEIMQKWLPIEISIKRQTGTFLNRPEFTAMLDNKEELQLMQTLNGIAMKVKGSVTGSRLQAMRQDLITIISRKITLVSGSNFYMLRTKAQALKLIDYYNTHERQGH